MYDNIIIKESCKVSVGWGGLRRVTSPIDDAGVRDSTEGEAGVISTKVAGSNPATISGSAPLMLPQPSATLSTTMASAATMKPPATPPLSSAPVG